MQQIRRTPDDELPEDGQMCVVRDGRGFTYYAYRKHLAWFRVDNDERIFPRYWQSIDTPNRADCRQKP